LLPTSDELKKHLGELQSCVVCSGKNLESWAKLDYLEARKCEDCGMISVNPHLNEEGLAKLYENYFSYRLDDKNSFEKRKIMYPIDRDWISKFINKGKVLDVGSSGGQFLSTFDPKKWERYGVEIDKNAAEYAKKEYSIPVRVGYFPELDFQEKFDLVMMRGVIEHFSDPISVLKKCSEVLKPGGYLFITATPAGDSFAFYIYREKWHLFTPLDHLHFFSVDLISKVLNKLGLYLIDRHYQYEETPYANPKEDYAKIKKDILLLHSGKHDQIDISPSFPGSIMTAVWKKKS